MTDDALPAAARFRDIVTREEELRAVKGDAQPLAIAKVLPHLDDHARRFIMHAPFVFIASVDADGLVDVSPKGDPAGFILVLDERTIAIPDRPGNNRLDTLRNVLSNPSVGLIFLIPGVTYTLRVSGRAIIVRDASLRDRMAMKGRRPEHVIVVEVDRVLSHCPKCMVRSSLWDPAGWPVTADVPTFGAMLKTHAQLAESLDEVETLIATATRETLY